ncbi:MAG: SUMF1/EgtB/PvdO family nonheme iron enzyme [Phycisphaerales bacterium]|nr:SUMF1/EgtB/PvdO family nonheme iron enzyme [Phycisphaerales bacterium]
MMNAAFNRTLAAAALAAALAAPASAELVFTTEYGIEFSTIGDAGNPVVPQSVGPSLYLGTPPTLIGSVNYEYRIARTETTVEQWAEFITAYRPHYTAGNPNFLPFTGRWIQWSEPQQKYVYDPAFAQVATDPSWRVAAAYCNWLHNDKASEAWAFESGAYDTSTFTFNPDGTINDQAEHSPAARFWIPTLDEWTKAMHWDPDRYGPGDGGYWVYPTSSDDAPVSGVPGVGHTSGGLPAIPLSSYFPVGSYTDVQSPWGLWDGSGSEREWIETIADRRFRLLKGTEPGVSPLFADRIDRVSNIGAPSGSGYGFRLAAVVPAQSTTLVVIGPVALITPRRRRS